MLKLSIIIPVYDVEKYISDCLLSIYNQQLKETEFEVIIINDGSPDNSKDILLEFKKNHKNIHFIDQENQGVSSARTKGLDVASGTYILFIDPDDTIYENSLHLILDRAFNDNLDVLYLNIELFNESGKHNDSIKELGNEEIILDGISHPRRTYLSTLYKRETIGNIRFIKGVTRGQDSLFNAMVQSIAKRCSYCSIPYYKYLIRTTSSRQYVMTETAFQGCIIAIESLNQFKNTHFINANKLQNEYFDSVVLIFVRRTLEWSIVPDLNKERFLIIKKVLKQNNLKHLIHSISSEFKTFDKTFTVFYLYNNLKNKYYSFLRFGSKIKRSLTNFFKKQ